MSSEFVLFGLLALLLLFAFLLRFLLLLLFLFGSLFLLLLLSQDLLQDFIIKVIVFASRCLLGSAVHCSDFRSHFSGDCRQLSLGEFELVL